MMGSEEGEVNLRVYVAVGRNVKDGKSQLKWAVENIEGKSFCLLHVHQPMNLVTLLNGKLSAGKLKNQAIKACQEFERLKTAKLMNQYLLFLSQMNIHADKLCIESSNVEKGILQLITEHGIRWLIMGAAAETSKSKKLLELASSKAVFVSQHAPPSCHIYFICKGSLIYSRPVDCDPHLTTTVTLSSSTSIGGSALTANTEENIDKSDNIQCLEHQVQSDIEVVGTVKSTTPTVEQSSEDDSQLSSSMERSECLPISLSSSSLDGELQGKETSDLHDRLEHAIEEAENAKQRAFEESLKRWRAEEDAFEALREAEAAEEVWKEEACRKQELEELLIQQKEEMEMTRAQHDQSVKELQLIQEQKPVLESQLREAYSSEKELEDKIIQAVELLIKFKETRDQLQVEYDSAMRKVNKLRLTKTENPVGISSEHFFGISFSDIIEATQNFNPSQRIGEGRFGSVFKGVISHMKVAIKMLPSSGSQSDSEFKLEVEVLSRLRHPNLVTLIAACPESRSLIFDFIDNGSLEDHLSGTHRIRPLSWQTRIKIANEICSALVFLHASNSYNVHGNLKPSNILLDANFVSKISDFGIHNLLYRNENNPVYPKTSDPEISAYMDPESFENGELTAETDVYSFGIILLRLLTSRPAISVLRDVKCALQRGNLGSLLDMSAGEWPLEQAKQLADLALRCCEKNHSDRPNILSDVWAVLQPLKELCNSTQVTTTSSSCLESTSQRKVPSHFVCPIYQEVMKDPHIAADGFTYEGEAIKGWFGSGAKTSPMTNLRLENCDLLPNYALYYAIQEWQQNT